MSRRGILQNPGARLTFRVSIPREKSFLTGWVGADDRSLAWASDGAKLTLYNINGEVAFSHSVYPPADGQLNRWQPFQIDLAPYQGDKVEIIFATDSIPNHKDVGWVGWGSPMIVMPEAIQEDSLMHCR